MPLSTSSSNPAPSQGRWQLRLLVFALMAPAWVLVGALARPAPRDAGIAPQAFWARKADWGPEFDLVLAGDSRVFRGVSPEIVGPATGLRVANFGFGGNGFTERYLQDCERLLNSKGARVVVLALTPSTLTPSASKTNAHLELQGGHAAERWLDGKVGGLLYPLRPLPLTDVLLAVQGRDKGHQEFHPSGWVESVHPEEDYGPVLQAYRDVFVNNQVADPIVRALLGRVSDWIKRGITVFVFRPPTSPAMAALENRLSGFDERDLRARFVERGATWLAFENVYASYDGSHLSAAAARGFSTDLGASLAKHLAGRTPRTR